jgi:hypothetical protein
MPDVEKIIKYSALTSVRLMRPCVFLSCSVDVGTLNNFSFHMYHRNIIKIYRAYSVVIGITYKHTLWAECRQLLC